MEPSDSKRGTKRVVQSSSSDEDSDGRLPTEGGALTPPSEGECTRRAWRAPTPDTVSLDSEPPADEGYVRNLDNGEFNQLLSEIYENAAQRRESQQEAEIDEDETRSLIAWIIQHRKEQKDRVRERVRQNKIVLEQIERDWRARGKIPKERKGLLYEMNRSETKDFIKRLTEEMGKWERVHFRTRMSSVIPEKPGKPYVYPIKIFFEDLSRIKEELEETDSSDGGGDDLNIPQKKDPKDQSPPKPDGSICC